MGSYKVGIEEDSDNCAESEMLSISDTSSEDENSRNRGGTKPKNIMKLRSIKLSRLPSLRSCMRPMKSPSSQSTGLLSGYAASSEQSTPVLMSDASPNSATNCSDARKENYQVVEKNIASPGQKSARTLSRRSSFKAMKSLSRMSSMRFRRPLMRKSSGGTDLKKKLKKTKSINKLATSGRSRPSTTEEDVKYDQPLIVSSSEGHKSPKYSKAHFQARQQNSESSFSSYDQNRKNSKTAKSKSDSSVRVLKRTSTLRPQRILTKTTSLKSKMPSRKCSEVSEISDSSVERATCSSTLKDSKFPHCNELQTGGRESGGISAMKVCSYTYCSLHGHQHGTLPPLKRFVSIRRHLLKAQKSKKPESHSVPKAKNSKNRRKGTHASQIVDNGDSADQEPAEDRRANSSVNEKLFKVELKEAGTQGVENKHADVSENRTEILPGEALYPQSSLEQHKTSDSLTIQQNIQVAFSEVQEASQEWCCIAVEPNKPIPEASSTERKVREIVASSVHNGDDKLISTVDQHEISDSNLPELKDSIQSGHLSLKLDDILRSSFKRDPVNATVYQEANEHTVASLNLEKLKDNSEANIEVLIDRTAARINGEKKVEDSKPVNGFLERVSRSGDSTPNCFTDECHKTQTKKKKFTGFWGLIYQHMVSGIATEVENQPPPDGRDKEEQNEGDHTLPQNNNPVSDQSLSGTDQEMSMKDHDAGKLKFELWQSDAIKLVQEAFDKVLSEIPDHSSDDQSISSDITSEHELLERREDEGGEQNISSSFDSTRERIVQDPEKKQLEAVTITTSEDDKAVSQLGNKSNQQISKNWSNLKKLIILKRFVKAMEKVRNFNPQKPRFLPVDPDPETEKVHLRHQTMEERKNADEWMLDYALRQVISKLAPAQKRKVDLLVQAFETVTPLPEISTHLKSNATVSCHATPVEGCNGSPHQSIEQNNHGLLSKASYPEMSFKENLDQVRDFPTAGQVIPETCSELEEKSLRCGRSDKETVMSVSETIQTYLEEEETVACNLNNRDNNSILKDYEPVTDSSPSKLEESTLSDKHSSKVDDAEGTFHVKLENGNILPEIYDSEVHGYDIKLRSKMFQNVNLDNAAEECQPKSSNPENYAETAAVGSEISSSFSELLEDTTACGGKANPRYEVHLESSPIEEPKSNEATDMAQEAKMEKQKYMRFWYLIYKHMASGSAEGGTPILLQGADYKEQGGDADTLLGRRDAYSSRDFSEMNQENEAVINDQNACSQNIECHQIEAIKLIEKAIDEIQLPDIQDDSFDDQTITGNKNPEMEIPKKHVEEEEACISTFADSAENIFRESKNRKLEHGATLDPRETWLNSNDSTAPGESEAVSKLGNSSKPQMLKSWSNLKKLILLKRFIKALEKARKFNPREPRYLPLDTDSEAEKVHLRHQSTEDRKNAEEWMLDFALQQVVAKLTPARKRKVELLVEAFETVTPTLEVKNRERHNAAASPHAKLILA